MKDIVSIRTSNNIKDQSLIQKIKTTIKTCQKVDKNAQQKILSLLTQGIVSNRQIFNQELHKNQIFYCNHESQPFKIRYFPTTLITHKVFRKLLRTEYNSIIAGRQGSDISISLQLYRHLSNMVHMYRFNRKESKPRFPQIFETIPKLLYYNVDLNTNEKKDQVNERIFSQCPELTGIVNNFNDLIENDKTYQHYYELQSNSHVIRLVDNFTEYFRHIRGKAKYQDRMSFYDKLLQDNKELTKQQVQYMKNENQKRSFYSRVQYTIKGLIQRVISQKQQDCDLTAPYLLNHLNTRKAQICYEKCDVNFRRCQYEELLQFQKSIAQLVDYWLFQLKEKIHLPLFISQKWIDSDLFKILRNKMIQKLPTNPFKDVLVTPLGFSQALKSFRTSQDSTVKQVLQRLKAIDFENLSQEEITDSIQPDLLALFDKTLKSIQSDFEQKISVLADHMTINQKNLLMKERIFAQLQQIRDINYYESKENKKIEIEQPRYISTLKKNKLQETFLPFNNPQPALLVDEYFQNSLLNNCLERKLLFQVDHDKEVIQCFYSSCYMMKLLKLRLIDVVKMMHEIVDKERQQQLRKIEEEILLTSGFDNKKIDEYFIDKLQSIASIIKAQQKKKMQELQLLNKKFREQQEDEQQALQM